MIWSKRIERGLHKENYEIITFNKLPASIITPVFL